MENEKFESNGFGANDYSNNYINTMDIGQTYQNGMNSNVYGIDNLSNMLSQTQVDSGNQGLGMMAELL